MQVLASARAGLESARGTSVTPTRIIYPKNGGITHTQEVGTIIPQEAWASFEPNRRAYAGLERDTFKMTGDLTYTDAIWVFNHGVAPLASGSVTDTSAYTWAFSPNNGADDLKSSTWQYAWKDLLATVGWQVPGVVCNRMAVTFTKAVGGAETGVTFDADFMTASVATQITSFTGSLSDRTINNALGNSVRSYVNGTGSAFGTTADTRINQATFEVTYGYVYRDGFDGTSNAIEVVRTGFRESKLTVQRYFNDKTELDAYIAKTSRRIRIAATGGLIGATTAVRTIQLDFGGVADAHSAADVNGMIYANIEYQPIDDSSIGPNDFKWTVIDTQATVS
ncbi:MAG TPA: hypothetical protein VFJ93_07650 [Gaiellaceae bacterium]|nr:hypothetical protein [Gaiellaceae bacterium]